MKDVRAISIVGGSPCCEATRSLEGKRLLLTQGVALPLTACTMPAQCKCRYQKYSDRRAVGDRRIFGSTLLYAINERRKAKTERRAANR
jgi:hypothetical protein